jgi:hypothetical protein
MRKGKMLDLLNTLQHQYARRIKQEARELFQISMDKRIIISNGGKRRAELILALSAAQSHFKEIKKIIADADKLMSALPKKIRAEVDKSIGAPPG